MENFSLISGKQRVFSYLTRMGTGVVGTVFAGELYPLCLPWYIQQIFLFTSISYVQKIFDLITVINNEQNFFYILQIFIWAMILLHISYDLIYIYIYIYTSHVEVSRLCYLLWQWFEQSFFSNFTLCKVIINHFCVLINLL